MSFSPTASVSAAAICAHCGLPAPPGPDGGEAFCCAGCRGAYHLIHRFGLSDYYSLRSRFSSEAVSGPVPPPADYADLDDPSVVVRLPMEGGDGSLFTARLAVSGIHCGACAWLIERAVSLVEGWESASVHLHDHTLQIVFDQERTRLSEIAAALASLGYPILPLEAEHEQQRELQENRAALIRIAAAGFFAANAMWIAVAIYAGDMSGIEGNQSRFLTAVGVLLGVGAVVWPGRIFFQGAAAALRTRTPHMDLPVSLGLVVGTTAGLWSIFSSRRDVYFDSIAMLVFLLLVGRWIQMRGQQRAQGRVRQMTRLSPIMARKIDSEGNTSRLRADALRKGDIIRVLPGEDIPADGTIVAQRTELDRSLLTGESRPVLAGPGEEVEAGVVNLASAIDVCVGRVGRESRLGALSQLVADAGSGRPRQVLLADRIGGYFVVTVITIAFGALFWHSQYSLSDGVSAAVATLVVACPCALALATPLAIALLLGQAAKRKTLIRDGNVMDVLAGGGTLWLDKTGTLTAGRPRVAQLFGPQSCLEYAASVERECHHPVADAILTAADEKQLQLAPAADVQSHPGSGVTGIVKGVEVVVGSRTLMKQRAIAIPDAFATAAQDAAKAGQTPVWIAVDGEATGLITVADPLREDAKQTLDRLRASGWLPGILSGDDPDAVKRLAAQLGLPPDRVHGGQSPSEKLSRVRQSQQQGERVLFVGDGANDAAALAAADAGIAIRGGAEISLRAAPVYLASGQLTALVQLTEASKRLSRLIRRTLGLSLAYNVIAATLAVAGLVTPLIAAILMPLSSLTVISLTASSRLFPKYQT